MVPTIPFLLAACSCLIGVVWRYLFLFKIHPPTQFIYSDMAGYVRSAQNVFNPAYKPGIQDTVFPPGTGYTLGLFYHLDPSGALAIWGQFVLSVLIPLLLASLADDLFGKKVALVTLALSSLYFPFIDYAGYFLAENPYLFAMILAMGLLVKSLKGLGREAILLGLFAGIFLGVAASFKNAFVASILFLVVVLTGACLRHRSRWAVRVLPAVLVGLSTVLVPLSVRCTLLSEGNFCLISNNTGFNLLLGHGGRIGVARFNDTRRNLYYTFGSPSALQHGYTLNPDFPFGPYDTEAALKTAWKSIRANPLETLLLSLEHVSDLFAGTVPWPASHAPERNWAIVFQQITWLVILIPAFIHLARRGTNLLQLKGDGLKDLLLTVPLLGMMAAAFVSIGEPRHRVPFDGFLIILAARFYTRGSTRAEGLLPGPEAHA